MDSKSDRRISRREFSRSLALTLTTGAFAHQHAAANPEDLFHAQGEMAGEPTATSVILQSRLTAVDRLKDGDVPGSRGMGCFELASTPEFRSPFRTEWVRAEPDHDFILRTLAAGLQAGTLYHYRLLYGPDTATIRTGPARTFRTLPGKESGAGVSFIVGNCMNYSKFHFGSDSYKGADKELGYPAMASILRLQPDFFVGAGDNVYYDHPREGRAQTLPEMRRKWHEQFVQQRFVELFGRTGSYWMKDDHDYRFDDADRTGDLLPSHELGVATFREQMPVVDPGAAGAVTYRTHRVSRHLQIWMTEIRDYRSPNRMPDGPGKTIWGREQKEWLQTTLLESDATFKIILSPTPMIGPDDGRKADNHTNPKGFRHEGEAFFAWLTSNGFRRERLYLVCGDRHWHYHSIHPSGFEEFSCGALNDENARMGRKPGDPDSTDPQSSVKQPFTSPKPAGGFLRIVVDPDEGARLPSLRFIVHDSGGSVLYRDVKR